MEVTKLIGRRGRFEEQFVSVEGQLVGTSDFCYLEDPRDGKRQGAPGVLIRDSRAHETIEKTHQPQIYGGHVRYNFSARLHGRVSSTGMLPFPVALTDVHRLEILHEGEVTKRIDIFERCKGVYLKNTAELNASQIKSIRRILCGGVGGVLRSPSASDVGRAVEALRSMRWLTGRQERKTQRLLEETQDYSELGSTFAMDGPHLLSRDLLQPDIDKITEALDAHDITTYSVEFCDRNSDYYYICELSSREGIEVLGNVTEVRDENFKKQ